MESWIINNKKVEGKVISLKVPNENVTTQCLITNQSNCPIACANLDYRKMGGGC